jgi:hypothetical protein
MGAKSEVMLFGPFITQPVNVRFMLMFLTGQE